MFPELPKIVRHDAKNSLAKSVPFAFRDLYAVLLDFYSPAELESFRKEYGDHILWQLYEDEITLFYRS